MLSRALAFMEERGTITDLSEYDDYDFTQGTIAAVTKGDSGVVVLTLTGDLTGATSSISLPADAVIYENNMETSSSSLKAGKHVRIALTSNGVPRTSTSAPPWRSSPARSTVSKTTASP